jgi:hypothetical protein
LTASEPTTSKAYTETIGFTPMIVFGSVLSLALALGFGWMLLDPQIRTGADAWLFFLTSIAFFAGVGLALLIAAARHPVALRVDDDGVTLGRSAGLFTPYGFWWRTRRVTVPWRDIDAIVVFGLAVGSRYDALSCIGLRLRAGAALPPGEPTRTTLWQYLSRALGQERPPEGVGPHRQILGWRLDQERLTKAVNAHAHPGVQVIDRS